MRLYYEVAVCSFRRALAYRGAVLAGMLTNAFFGAVRCFMFVSLYGAGGAVAGYTLRDTLSYTWLTQSLISIGAGWLSWDLGRLIASGDVITDLSRPWNFYGYWLCRTLGDYALNLLLRGALTYAVGVLTFGAALPSPGQALLFVPALLLAMLISCTFCFLVNLSAFWLLDNSGVMLIGNVVMNLFSGFLLPLVFFPPALAALAELLPFQGISHLPAQIFLGQLAGRAALEALLVQLGWVLVLALLALLALNAAMRKVVIQGG